jgi:uncharacterized protein
MLVRLLYFILITFLARLLFRALAQRRGPSIGGERRHGERLPAIHKGRMVRDPVCGVYVPESHALVETRGSERFYFCSERCRRVFRETA